MNNGMNPYLKQKIMSASPEQLVCYIYDAGIIACKKKDITKAGQAIRELINALNFDYKEMALPLFDLYKYCLNNVNSNNFEHAQEILEGLREAWYDAHLKVKKPASQVG
jgi:flagellar protein FliS